MLRSFGGGFNHVAFAFISEEAIQDLYAHKPTHRHTGTNLQGLNKNRDKETSREFIHHIWDDYLRYPDSNLNWTEPGRPAKCSQIRLMRTYSCAQSAFSAYSLSFLWYWIYYFRPVRIFWGKQFVVNCLGQTASVKKAIDCYCSLIKTS